MHTMISAFSAAPGSRVSAFIRGVQFSELVLDCVCGFRRSDTNIVPRGLCPKCNSHWLLTTIQKYKA